MRYEKDYVILVDGEPNRYYKDSQIKTYMTRANAEKEARRIMHNYTKAEVGKFAAKELQEITKEAEE